MGAKILGVVVFMDAGAQLEFAASH